MFDVGFMKKKNNSKLNNQQQKIAQCLRVYFYNWQT